MGEEKIDEQINQIKQEALEESSTVVEKKEDLVTSEKINEQINDIKDEGKIEENKKTTKQKKPKNKLFLFIGIGILLLVIIGVIIFILFGSKKSESSLSSEEQKRIIEEYGKALEDVIEVHIQNKGILLSYEEANDLVKIAHKVECSDYEIYESGKIYIGNCSIDRKDVKYTYGVKTKEEKVELKEGTIKVYVSKNDNKATLKEPSNKDDYTVYDFDLNEKYSNMFLLSETDDFVIYYDNNNKGQIYNFKNKEKALSHVEYQSILPIKFNDNYDTNYIAVNTSDTVWTFYNIHDGTRSTTDNYYDITSYKLNKYQRVAFEVDAISDGKIVVSKHETASDTYKLYSHYGMINYRTGEVVIPFGYYSFVYEKNYIMTKNSERTELYDYSGNGILKNKYDFIYDSQDGYVFVNDNDELKIVNINGEDVAILGNYKVTYYGFMRSYKDGILIQITDDTIEPENIDEKCLNFYYNIKTKELNNKNGKCGTVSFD